MTRLNRPDSLLTELRDIRRRLHVLETALRVQAGGGAALLSAAPASPGPEGTTASLRCAPPAEGAPAPAASGQDTAGGETPAGDRPEGDVPGAGN